MTRKITSGTKEWADYNVNCFKGCANDCRYCYAKMMALRFGRATEDTWKNMVLREDVVNKNFRKYGGRVMFPSSHDIVDIPGVKEACFSVLRRLLEAGNEVLVTSKPSFSIVSEMLDEFSGFRDNMQFRFTITSSDDALLSFWEPNAPPYRERLESLILAYKEGFKTSVSIEPFLDCDPVPLYHELIPYVTESIWIGPMNHIRVKNLTLEEMPEYERIKEAKRVENLQKIYDRLVDEPKIRFKDSMMNKLGYGK